MKITLQFRNEDSEVEVRRYSNLFELRLAAAGCDFCNILHDKVKDLEDPDTGAYCKQSWGTEFSERLLRLSPVVVSHKAREGENNVFVSCFLDAQNTPGYPGGPRGLEWWQMLGGIYVASGQLPPEF